jgi:hypothetical protein
MAGFVDRLGHAGLGMFRAGTAAARRRPRVAVVVAAVLVAICAGSVVLWLRPGGNSPLARPHVTDVVWGGQVPHQAAQAARDVVSGDENLVRAALSPALAGHLPGPGAVAPAGSTVDLEAGSWNRYGLHAAATGLLTVPGQPPRRVTVGFVLVDGRWRVTVMEPEA